MTAGSDLWPQDDGDAQAPASGDESTLTVPQLGARMEALLLEGFPRPFWLVGEANGLTRARTRGGAAGHWYFTLVDDQGSDDRRAAVEVIVWRSTVIRLFGPRGRLRGVLTPEDGVVLRVRVTPNWYGPRGQVSFVIADVDPEYTLGSLDRERRLLLARLQAEGADQWNKQRPLSEVPLRLGLVTSEGSAAHQDVLQTLRASGLGFSVVCCDARTQGAETARSVAAALATLERLELDAVLLVRGGGSRLDLAWFDKEELVRAVTRCRLPVLTGIGHEIDTSLADLVAHSQFKTPTAVAEHLVARARAAQGSLEDVARRVLDAAGVSLLAGQRALEEAIRRLGACSREALLEARLSLAETGRRLESRVGQRLRVAEEGVTVSSLRLASASPTSRLQAQGEALDRRFERLAARSRAALERADQHIQGVGERVRLLDPRTVLARGYAWLRRTDGTLLKDGATVVPGERLTAVLRDGELPLRHDERPS